MKKSTCSSGARPARISQSQGNDWDLKVGEACSLSTLYDCVLSLESAGLCGKMSPLLFPAAEVRISDDLFPCSVDGMSRSLKADGENVESSPRLREDSEWHGEYLTLNLPEWNNFRGQSRSAGSVSSLSDILVSGNIPPRYYLTVKCAEGILRRAASRGRELPPRLKEALERQAAEFSGTETIMPKP